MSDVDLAVPTPGHTSLFADYQAPAGSYDELCREPQQPRSHWEYVIRSLEALGPQELLRREQEVRRLLRENGVTYNVYSDARGEGRPWALDLLPTLLTSQEWRDIERGLIQRAELFNLILADLYGPQQLIKKGLLPPHLIYSHSGFLRACVGITPPSRHFLFSYAADLARSPDGNMWVLSDRTQTPSGAGYALENRLTLARVFPSLYRDAQVHRLALYFRTLRNSLETLVPQQREPGRTVLLTPGPGNETYFEHAYVAQYLDYTLVQGSDLTLRDGRVWLKTLDGLQPVDVILRRVDDTFCDPLELRKDSLLGTPGLVQATRTNQVAVANPLGVGILENPALMAFLPRLCRELLGQELRLPSVATWWCGGEDERRYVLAHLDRLVIKPISPYLPRVTQATSDTVFGAQLSAMEREALIARIQAQPHRYVAQEYLPLSTTPTFADGKLVPRPLVLRSFLVARDDAYVVMPGGLARVAPGPDSWDVSNQTGGVSKDIWVLASEPEQAVSLLPSAEQPVALTRSGGEIPSRVADNLFWLGRYTERMESSARVFREMLLRLLDTEVVNHDPYLPGLLSAVTHQAVTYLHLVGQAGNRRLMAKELELLAVILEPTKSGSLRSTLDALLQAGRSVRDRLSDDTARVLNTLDQELSPHMRLDQTVESLTRVVSGLASFTGLSVESMSRGQGFRFLEIGRRLERTLHTISLLHTACEMAPGGRGALWEVVLAMTDSLQTYRRRYYTQVDAQAVLDLLLHDESNPRSVGYQLARLQEHVDGLPRQATLPHRSPAQRLVLQSLTALRTTDIEGLSQAVWEEPVYETLDELFAQLGTFLLALSDVLSRTYFSHIEAQQQLMEHQHDSLRHRPYDPLSL